MMPAATAVGSGAPPEATVRAASADGGVPQAAFGATRILQEGGHQFDFIDSKSPLSKYKVVILPDTIPVSKALAAKLSKFVASGGKLDIGNRIAFPRINNI